LDAEHGQLSDNKRGEEASMGGGAGSGGGGGGSRRETRRFHAAPEGATSTALYEVFEKPPKIMLTTPEEVADKALKGRAAMFVLETGNLYQRH
jgi:hypothetical protein